VTDDIRPEFVILNHSYEGYGMVIDLLSRTPPFSKMEVGDLSAALRLQLGQGHHVAVVAGPRLLGYAGWLPTLQTLAEPWVMDQGLLVPVLDGTANCKRQEDLGPKQKIAGGSSYVAHLPRNAVNARRPIGKERAKRPW
jgi:hypothetical protein